MNQSSEKVTEESKGRKKVGLGAVQMRVNIGDKEVNLNRAIKQIKDVENRGADIITLPEMFLTGYNFSRIGDKLPSLAERKEGKSIQKLSHLAKNLNVVIVAPIPEIRDRPDIVFNSAVIINNDGEILGSYDKSHIWTEGKKYFRPGNSLPIFETDFGKIGVMICYDAGFPEVARTLSLKGAEILIMPSAWRIQDYSLWDINTRCRALENTVYLVATNIIGKRNGKPHFFGNARIVNPKGDVLSEGEIFGKETMSERDTAIVKKVDLKNIDKIRNEYQYLRDRRPEIYVEEM